MDQAPRSRSRHRGIARGEFTVGDSESTLTGRVQYFQVGEGASTACLDWDSWPDQPLILIVDELAAYRTFAFLLLPESFGEAAVLQPLQHPRTFPLREIRVPNRIEWVGVRFNPDVPDDTSFCCSKERQYSRFAVVPLDRSRKHPVPVIKRPEVFPPDPTARFIRVSTLRPAPKRLPNVSIHRRVRPLCDDVPMVIGPTSDHGVEQINQGVLLRRAVCPDGLSDFIQERFHVLDRRLDQ